MLDGLTLGCPVVAQRSHSLPIRFELARTVQKIPMKHDSFITPEKREIVRRIGEVLDELEKLEREYGELEDAFTRDVPQLAQAAEWTERARVTLAAVTDVAPPVAPLVVATEPVVAKVQVPVPAREKPLGQAGRDRERTRVLFERRDALRRDLIAMMLESQILRRRLVETMLPEPTPEVAALAQMCSGAARDRPLVDAICAQPLRGLAVFVREVVAHFETRAPVMAVKIRQAHRPIKEIEDRLVAANMGLCHTIARRYSWCSMPYEDLVQEGAVGLQVAVERFEVARGFTLATYAQNWIRSFVNRATENDGLVRFPNHLHPVLRRAYKLFAAGATEEEVAEQLKIRLSVIRSFRGANSYRSLDQPLWDDENARTPLEMMPDESMAVSLDAMDQSDQLERVRRELVHLRESDRIVIEQRLAGRTLEQVGEVFDVSRERIRQIEKRGIERLQKRLRRRLLPSGEAP